MAKFYQNKDYKKSFVKNIKVFAKTKRKKKQEHGHERYKNLSEDENQKLVEYRKKYYKIWKYKSDLQINTDWRFLILKTHLK